MARKSTSGMRGNRSRNQNGQLRRKRSDTHVGTTERQYSRDFGGRSDKHLGTLLMQRAKESLTKLLRGR